MRLTKRDKAYSRLSPTGLRPGTVVGYSALAIGEVERNAAANCHCWRLFAQVSQRRAPSNGAALIVWVHIELGAVGSEGHDLAIGTAETRARSVLFAAPDHHVLQNVLPLLRRDELVHDGGAHFRREKTQACKLSLRIADLLHLRDQRKVDKGAVNRRRHHPKAQVHTDRLLAYLHERVAQSQDSDSGRAVK